ncbi:MAG TPA: hypothetical protein VJG90_03975 [Candidatus Nanoarchaeia archaeon]|nr:hypothetical protein [Candidatus Nanoarchaeia archaeon]
MKKKKLSEKEWDKKFKEIQANPQFQKDVDAFIKATTSTSF